MLYNPDASPIRPRHHKEQTSIAWAICTKEQAPAATLKPWKVWSISLPLQFVVLQSAANVHQILNSNIWNYRNFKDKGPAKKLLRHELRFVKNWNTLPKQQKNRLSMSSTVCISYIGSKSHGFWLSVPAAQPLTQGCYCMQALVLVLSTSNDNVLQSVVLSIDCFRVQNRHIVHTNALNVSECTFVVYRYW